MPNQGKNVSFQYGTQNDYDNLTTKDSNTFYITSDTKRLYLGEDLYNMPNCVIPVNYYEYNNGENYLLYQGFCEYGADFIATDIYPTEIGKKLIGWASSPSGSPHFLFENVTSPMSLYPIVQDDPSMCVVTYYSQDGNTILGTEYVNKNKNAQGLATNPTKTTDSLYKYTFLGWNNASNSTSINSNILNNITQNLDLYAVFDKVIKDDTISDSWEEIIANCNNGTYSSKYQVGDLKTIDIGSEGLVQMQIVAINADELADSNNTAPITWISKQLLNTAHRMNPAYSSGTEGTGSLGGWEKTEMRSYLKETVKPLIPETVRNAIKSVKKYTRIVDNVSDLSVSNVLTTEDVWIPSYQEVFGNYSYESSGVYYSTAFPDDASRIKSKTGSSAILWWLRSAYTNQTFSDIGAGGYYGFYNANRTIGVILGFCT